LGNGPKCKYMRTKLKKKKIRFVMELGEEYAVEVYNHSFIHFETCC